jgi:hypothetical protein
VFGRSLAKHAIYSKFRAFAISKNAFPGRLLSKAERTSCEKEAFLRGVPEKLRVEVVKRRFHSKRPSGTAISTY